MNVQRHMPWLFAILAPSCAAPGTSAPPFMPPIHELEIVDLTWTLGETSIAWPASPGFSLETQFDRVIEGGWYYLSHVLHGPGHGGTHIDAPVHFREGSHSTDQIPLQRLIGPGVAVDVRRATRIGPKPGAVAKIFEIGRLPASVTSSRSTSCLSASNPRHEGRGARTATRCGSPPPDTPIPATRRCWRGCVS